MLAVQKYKLHNRHVEDLFYRLHDLHGMLITMLIKDSFLQRIADNQLQYLKEKVSPGTALEELLLLVGMAILSNSVPEKRLSASRAPQN